MFIFDTINLTVFLPSEDWLLVGTKPGHLLLYRIKKDAGKTWMRSVCVYVFVCDAFD